MVYIGYTTHNGDLGELFMIVLTTLIDMNRLE